MIVSDLPISECRDGTGLKIRSGSGSGFNPTKNFKPAGLGSGTEPDQKPEPEVGFTVGFDPK